MKLREIRDHDRCLDAILETGTAGASVAGNIASVPMGMGATIKRMPTEPNLFGYMQPSGHRKNKRKKRG